MAALPCPHQSSLPSVLGLTASPACLLSSPTPPGGGGGACSWLIVGDPVLGMAPSAQETLGNMSPVPLSSLLPTAEPQQAGDG